MADLDTRQKRASSVRLTKLWSPALPLPDGVIDQGDRQHTAGMYGGTFTSSGISGTLNKTLDDLTLSATAKLDIAGTLSKTLDNLTLAGTATLDIVGTVSKTLDDLSLSGAATLGISGSLNQTLADLTFTNTQTITKLFRFVSDEEGFTEVGVNADVGFEYKSTDGKPDFGSVEFYPIGTAGGLVAEKARTGASLTWESLGVPAGSLVTVAEVSSIWLRSTHGASISSPNLKVRIVNSSNTTVHSAGDLVNKSFGGLASWIHHVPGVTRNIDSAYQASNTEIKVELECLPGQWNNGGSTECDTARIDTIDLVLTCTVPSALGTLLINGTGTPSLADSTLAGTATLAITGSLGTTLENLTSSATGTVDIIAVGTATLADLTLSATGTLDIAGSGNQTLENLTLVSTATLDIKATLNETLEDLTLAGTGTTQASTSGALNVTLEDLTLAGTSTLSISAQASITLDDLTAASTATIDIIGTLNVTLEDATLSGSSTFEVFGILDVVLEDLTLLARGRGNYFVAHIREGFVHRDSEESVEGMVRIGYVHRKQ